MTALVAAAPASLTCHGEPRHRDMDLNTLWFSLLGVLLAGYAILDGFDLGVGILHPVARTTRPSGGS